MEDFGQGSTQGTSTAVVSLNRDYRRDEQMGKGISC